MSKDIQLGKDQIENYQNGDVDRPYKSKEKQVIHCENCFHAYNCPEGYNRSKCASFKDVNYKLYKQIEQLKAENERAFKKGINKALSIIKKLQRHDLEWEWMAESEDGEYIIIDEAKNALIEALNKEQS